MSKIKVAIVGCGNISGIYFKNLTKRFNNLVEIAACVDIIKEKAEAAGKEYGIPKVLSFEEVLNDCEIKLIVNLTIPASHAEVSLAALEAGKHVYLEKPLAISREDGRRMVDLAREKNVLLGCAPETFMGAGIQTCRKLIDDGVIGKPIAASAYMMCHGHESWHPAPEFYYKIGGGPMFDMGPYYLTALITLLGSVRRVSGSVKKSFEQRTITSESKKGTIIDVEVPTHLSALLDFADGTTANLTTSFDVWHHNMPNIEIYGTEGSLKVPDPNTFAGPVMLKLKGETQWREIPLTHEYSENSRGVGVADMAAAISGNRKHRAHGDLAYHVLDIMHAVHESSDSGKHILLQSSCERPTMMPMGVQDGELD